MFEHMPESLPWQSTEGKRKHSCDLSSNLLCIMLNSRHSHKLFISTHRDSPSKKHGNINNKQPLVGTRPESPERKYYAFSALPDLQLVYWRWQNSASFIALQSHLTQHYRGTARGCQLHKDYTEGGLTGGGFSRIILYKNAACMMFPLCEPCPSFIESEEGQIQKRTKELFSYECNKTLLYWILNNSRICKKDLWHWKYLIINLQMLKMWARLIKV